MGTFDGLAFAKEEGKWEFPHGTWAISDRNKSRETKANAVAAAHANPAQPMDSQSWYTVRVQTLQCCDDDGGRKCPITLEEVQKQVDLANRVYSKARVRFVWSPATDSAVLKNTVINSLMPRDADTPN